MRKDNRDPAKDIWGEQHKCPESLQSLPSGNTGLILQEATSSGSSCSLLLVWSGGATDDAVSSPPQLSSLSHPDPIRDIPVSKVKDDSGLWPLPVMAF